jgi:hypothetical protein
MDFPLHRAKTKDADTSEHLWLSDGIIVPETDKKGLGRIQKSTAPHLHEVHLPSHRQQPGHENEINRHLKHIHDHVQSAPDSHPAQSPQSTHSYHHRQLNHSALYSDQTQAVHKPYHTYYAGAAHRPYHHDSAKHAHLALHPINYHHREDKPYKNTIQAGNSLFNSRGVNAGNTGHYLSPESFSTPLAGLAASLPLRRAVYDELAELNGKSPSVLGEPGLDPRLACARTVSTFLHRTIGVPIVDGVASLEDEMRRRWHKGHFVHFTWDGSDGTLQPFDVVVGHRKLGEHSHTALYTGGGLVFNNNAVHKDLRYEPVDIFKSRQTPNHRLGYANTEIYRWVSDDGSILI